MANSAFPLGTAWGSITGTLSAQTDLQAALDAKKTDSMATNKLLGRGTAGTGVIEEITLGTGLTLTGTTLDVTGGGGVSALAAIGSSPNANGATISGSTLNLEPASASFGGVVTTGTQTFAGAKTILDTLTHLQTASTGNTVVNGIELTNNTTASSGNQMYSGAVYWKGNGWRTGAGGVSTTCEFRAYILPVQAAGAAECTLNFEANQNGTGWVNVLQLRANSASYQVLAEFGTVALPSYSYRVDPDTGHRRSGVNAQAYVCGGADIFGIDVNGLCIGTLGMNNTNFGVHPTTTTKHGGLWRSRNSISVDYFNFQNDSATQEASLFRSSGTSGDWKWRMTGGSAALPSYSFYSQTTIGMYAAGTNILGFAVAGVETFRISQGLQRTSYNASNYLDVTVGSTGTVTLNAVGSGARFAFSDGITLPAGSATAGTSPLKMTAGTNLTTAEAGAFEYDGTNLFFTRAGTTRENVLVAVDNATAPATGVGVAIVNYYGSAATNFLGDPNRWMSINILGTVYKVPLYT
jgi:hypothetical protein